MSIAAPCPSQTRASGTTEGSSAAPLPYRPSRPASSGRAPRHRARRSGTGGNAIGNFRLWPPLAGAAQPRGRLGHVGAGKRRGRPPPDAAPPPCFHHTLVSVARGTAALRLQTAVAARKGHWAWLDRTDLSRCQQIEGRRGQDRVGAGVVVAPQRFLVAGNEIEGDSDGETGSLDRRPAACRK